MPGATRGASPRRLAGGGAWTSPRLIVELEITDGLTLKDKRQVIRSLLDRIRGRFNVGAAEVDQLDSVRYATLAMVGVANEHRFLNEMMSKAG